MYVLGAALTAFSSWAMFSALREQRHPVRRWIVYAALVIMLSFTHYYALFTIAAQFLFLFVYGAFASAASSADALPRSVVRPALGTGALMAAVWVLWLPAFLSQRAQVQDNYWTRPVAVADVTFACYQMFIHPEDATSEPKANAAVALFCAAIVLSLLWRPGPAEWFVFCAAVLPFLLSILSSAYDTKIFHVRYFVFAHLFILVALARLVWRIRAKPFRAAVCLCILANGASVHALFWERMDFASRPGAQGVVAHLSDQRRPGEPVIVCSPYYFFALLYHARDRTDWYLYSDGKPFPHYGGTAIIDPDMLVTTGEMMLTRSPRVWVVEMRGGGWSHRTVPAPEHWKPIGKPVEFREAYGVQGTMVVRAYATTASESRGNPVPDVQPVTGVGSDTQSVN